jgi:Carboxypeptidase regulatory-like domain
MAMSREFKITVVTTVLLGGALAVAIVEMVVPGFFTDPRKRGPRRHTILGRVVCEESGKGCAGVQVVLLGEGAEKQTRSDAAGYFAFENLPCDGGLVCAYPDDRPVASEFAGDGDLVILRVALGRRLRGRITDCITGAPIIGARLSIDRASKLKTTTDERGRYEIPGVARTSDLRIEAEGYPVHEFSYFEPEGSGLAGDLTLGPGGTLEGRVVDPEGHGVEGVRVLASREMYLLSGSPKAHDGPSTISGPDGAFRIEGLTKDRCYGLHTPDGLTHSWALEWFVFAGDESRLRAGFELTGLRVAPVGGAFRDIALTARPRGDLQIRVFDPDGKPARFVDVVVSNLQLGHSRRASTGSEGRVTLEDLGAGRFDFTVKKSSYRQTMAQAVVLAGETVEVDVTLDPGASFSGTVVGHDGQPVGKVTVHAWSGETRRLLPHLSAPFERYPECSTWRDGTFHLRGLEPGRDYLVAAWCDEFGASEPVVLPAGASKQVIRLAPWSTLRLKLLDAASGEPLAATLVEIVPEGDLAPLRTEMWKRPTKTDDHGIIVTQLPAGRYGLRPEYVDLPPVDSAVTIPAGVDELDLEVRLDPGATLAGSVCWADGKPAANVRVWLFDRDLDQVDRHAFPEDDGRFQFAGLRRGRRRVVITSLSLETHWAERWMIIDIEDESSTAVLSLGPRHGGALNVLVIDDTGKIVPGARVSIRDKAGRLVPTGAELDEETIRRVQLRTRRDGFDLGHLWTPRAASVTNTFGTLIRGSLDPGEIRVEVSAEGFLTRRFTTVIRPEEATSRQVVLERD